MGVMGFYGCLWVSGCPWVYIGVNVCLWVLYLNIKSNAYFLIQESQKI